MPIHAITPSSPTQNSKNKFTFKKLLKNSVRDTGYAGAAFGVASAIAGANKKIKLHKNLAYLSGLFTLLHIGIIEYYKHRKAK